MSVPTHRLVALLFVALTVTAGAAQDDGPLLLTEDSGALLELDGESQIVITGIQGTIAVRPGRPGEIRFEARTRDNLREPRAVALWLEGRRLRLEPAEGDDGAETLIEITVAPGMDVDVRASSSLVKVSALSGAFRLEGDDVDLSARGLGGTADIDVRRGKIFLSGVADSLSVEGSELAVTVEYPKAPVYLLLEESTIDIVQAEDAIEGELEKSVLDVTGLKGPVELSAVEGRLSFEAATGGGVLDLDQTPLVLTRTTGVLDIRTDSKVEFTGHDGALKIHGYGAEIRGVGAEGVLEIETDGATVHLDQIGSQINVRGQDLELQILGSKGDVSVETTGSNIVIKKATGALTLENEFGDIEVAEASEAVDVASRDGDVRLTGLKSRVKLKADGDRAEVGWVAMTVQEDSSIENAGGDVRVRLPGAVSVRVDAQARYGRIETDLPGLEVSGDGHSASGLVGRGRGSPQAKRPMLRVKSGGDLYIGTRQ